MFIKSYKAPQLKTEYGNVGSGSVEKDDRGKARQQSGLAAHGQDTHKKRRPHSLAFNKYTYIHDLVERIAS